MNLFDFLDNANMLIAYSILLVVILGVVLVIIVFTVKYKSYQDKNNYLGNFLSECKQKSVVLNKKLDEQIKLNVEQGKEIAGIGAMKNQFQKELERLHEKIVSHDINSKQAGERILELEKVRSDLEANIANANTNESKAQGALSDALKRNEFWVEQMSELRVKYEALQLKLR